MTWVAVALAAAAVALALSGGGGLRVPRRRRRTRAVGVLAGLAGAGWWLVDEPRLLVLGAIGVVVVTAAVRLVERHRADRAAARVRSRVVETCDALHAELAAGQTPATALERAAAEWPALQPASRTGAAGGDVPAALRELAAEPGGGRPPGGRRGLAGGAPHGARARRRGRARRAGAARGRPHATGGGR
ncbi:hypothetical protein [Nocardioides sp. TF02-7]|uniref:hypothetical protein n=1 Tax=Nocardioides sp. TF02-7 TaxID=2917724 RepID=UPI001F06FF85|nr:hypothetical protein [Nocardioides sp. TF02-7]UMG94016.1 hypothetical protein MF408_08050 [Nocardioides sp. TF02-7]